MAINKGAINANAQKMIDFINQYTSVTGVSSYLETGNGWYNVIIKYPTGPETSGRLAQINVSNAPSDNSSGAYILYGGGDGNCGSTYLPEIGYVTQHGYLFLIRPSNGQARGFIISKTNNDDYGCALQQPTNQYAYARGCSQAINDKSGVSAWSNNIMFPQHPGGSNWTDARYRRDQIQLVPIPTRGNNNISYFPHAFWIPFSPTRNYGIIKIGDKQYVMSSYMALED